MRILHDFDYRRPGTVEEALALLAEYGEKASPIAGGTDLVVYMKYRNMMQLVDGVGTPCGFCHASLKLLLRDTRAGKDPADTEAELRTMWPYAEAP